MKSKQTYIKIRLTDSFEMTTTTAAAATPSSTALNSAVAEISATSKIPPVEVFRASYKPLTNIVSKISMNFDIHDGKTTVTSEMAIEPNPKSEDPSGDLVLDGDETAVKLMILQVDGKDLVANVDYELSPGKLVVKGSALNEEGKGLLKTVVEIVPEENTQLSGLYKSGSMYCTQCEAMGFRRITYYP